MIRQLGTPTVFLTLSAAEKQWTELIVILFKCRNQKDITIQQAFYFFRSLGSTCKFRRVAVIRIFGSFTLKVLKIIFLGKFLST
jgi:hypothetical protein